MANHTGTTRILFMGTPEFAVPSLRSLVDAGDRFGWQVVAVATQPDRRAGRGKKLAESPVKAIAREFDLPVLQPLGFRKHPDAVEELRSFTPDLYVVAAYGIILPGSVLEIPTFGSINVHASILPQYRGASPINAAILDGVSETGISIMLMDEGMDTGPVLKQERQRILPHDTAETLSASLAELGAEALMQTLPAWLAGEVPPIPQSDLPGTPSICRMINKEEGKIDWTEPAEHIERMTRAFAPWPSAYTTWHAQPLKIWMAEVRSGKATPGLVVETAEGPAVGTGSGLLLLKEVQPAGKRAMNVANFVNGAHGFVGSNLGSLED